MLRVSFMFLFKYFWASLHILFYFFLIFIPYDCYFTLVWDSLWSFHFKNRSLFVHILINNMQHYSFFFERTFLLVLLFLVVVRRVCMKSPFRVCKGKMCIAPHDCQKIYLLLFCFYFPYFIITFYNTFVCCCLKIQNRVFFSFFK